jgi:cell division protein FtsA
VAGVALVDIGGGTTDVTIFQEGIIRHTAVIPFGGNIITKDIKEGCTVMEEQAEKLKVRFGSALAEEIIDNRIITISGINGRESKEISERNLARIIQARMEEILDYVVWEIRRTGYERKLIAGMVLTGGGSQLRHLDLLSEFHTGLATRIGKPTEHLAAGFDNKVENPIYATAVGLLIEGIATEEEDRLRVLEGERTDSNEDDNEFGGGDNYMKKMLNKSVKAIADFLSASPETDI